MSFNAQETKNEQQVDEIFFFARQQLEAGNFSQAEVICKKIIQYNPDYVHAWHLLGIIALKVGKNDIAIGFFRRAIDINPTIAEIFSNLGIALQRINKLGISTKALRTSIALDPDLADAHYNLANTLRDQWKLDEAIRYYKNAVALDPANSKAYSCLLFALNYSSSYGEEAVFEKHKQWAKQHAAPFISTQQSFENTPVPNRRLRICYISPDFCYGHPVMFFMEPVLANHDHSKFEIICYADTKNDDGMHKFRGLVDCWRNIPGIGDEKIADQIRNDKIDILVDLAGHTAENRMLLFARKPAPVQVTYLGYPNTTGLPTVDFRITDSYADPVGQTESLYSEELMRLPHAFCCYQPPNKSPEINKLPALKTGFITFGCFNDPLRINKKVISTWLEILKRVPNSRLILQLRLHTDSCFVKSCEEMFLQAGIAKERLEVNGFRSFHEHLKLYNRVDICLDTFPFNGHTNTCHSLWMGVPVVVLSGRNYISRMGLSLLSNIGLHDLIADSERSYIDKAVELAGDLYLLQELRTYLRPLLTQSNLTDGQRFTCSLEEAYRLMWHRWCS